MSEWIGRRFGRLRVLTQQGLAKDGHRIWLCGCDCGGTCMRQSNNLLHGARNNTVQSCGCARRDVQIHHGGHGTATYRSLRAAIDRCHNPSSKDFHRYGARGITVAPEWRASFTQFVTDVGARPDGTSLDRWPNHMGNYEPGNCRWATPTEQARNRRNTLWTEMDGERVTVAEVAGLLGISVSAAGLRFRRGKLNASL